MRDHENIVDSLKRMLKARGVTYASLAKSLGISEISVKRMLSNRSPITLDRLAAMCDIIGTNFSILAQIAKDKDSGPQQQFFTMEQEEALAADMRLFICFNCVARGMSADHIHERFKISPIEVKRALLNLDKLKIIELHANDRVKLLVSRYPEWIEEGPLSTLYENQIKAEFLTSTFRAEGESFQFISRNLSLRSRKIIAQKFEKLLTEIRELADVDEALVDKGRSQTTFLIAARPWTPSVLNPYLRSKTGEL